MQDQRVRPYFYPDNMSRENDFRLIHGTPDQVKAYLAGVSICQNLSINPNRNYVIYNKVKLSELRTNGLLKTQDIANPPATNQASNSIPAGHTATDCSPLDTCKVFS